MGLTVKHGWLTPAEWRRRGFLVARVPRPFSRGTRYVVSRWVDGKELGCGVAYSRAELDTLLRGLFDKL